MRTSSTIESWDHGAPITGGPEVDRPGVPTWQHEWVLADPFRAHLRHVSAATGTPWPVLAVLVRVSLPSARSLLAGRRGRPVRRICPEVAERLLGLSPTRVRQASLRFVPAERTVRRLRRLLVEHDLTDLARRCGLRTDQLGALLAPVPASRCPELVAAAVEAAYRQAWSVRLSTGVQHGPTADLVRAA